MGSKVYMHWLGEHNISRAFGEVDSSGLGAEAVQYSQCIIIIYVVADTACDPNPE